MEVFEFKKSLLTRQQEAIKILGTRDIPIPARMVQKEWSLFLEIALNPTGWQALWRIPRLVCHDLSIKYPALVMGTVEKVLFDDLKAIFIVEAVENDHFHLPEKQIIPLFDLWPLKNQRDNSLDIHRSADCIDQLRFFYQHVWMPWDYDDDDDCDWPEKHLESRIKFYCDLKNRTMSKRLTCHILTLLDEANHLQKKRELLEVETDDENGTDPVDIISEEELLHIRLRLNSIKNEIETLEFFAPEMRIVYEQVRFSEDISYSNDHCRGSSACIIIRCNNLDEQIKYLEKTKQTIGLKQSTRIFQSLQEAFDRSLASDNLYLPPGQHEVNFVVDLNAGGSIKAVDVDRTQTVIRSKQDDKVLLVVSGDYHLENLTFDCSNVETGILVKSGDVTFTNCSFVGDPEDLASTGILVYGNGTIRFDHCVVENFSYGICADSSCNIQLCNTTVRSCFDGIKIVNGSKLQIRSASVENCRNYGTVLDVQRASMYGEKHYQDYRELCELEEFYFDGICKFENNCNGNFVIFHKC